MIRTGPAERPNVAVTIDDIFGPGGADQLHGALDLARDRNVKLTFFPTGGGIEAHTSAGKGDVWKRVVAEGHEIGNHTYTHRGLTSLPDQEIRDELNWTQKLLTDAVGGVEYKLRLMRPPGGAGGTTPTGDPPRQLPEQDHGLGAQRLDHLVALPDVRSVVARVAAHPSAS